MTTHDKTLRIAALVAFAIALLFFVLGLSYPIMTTTTKLLSFSLSSHAVYLFDSISMFYQEGEWFLAAIILIFTILLPSIKFIELFNRIIPFKTISKTLSHFLHAIDKWSMLDVFLVALLLLNFKMSSYFVGMEIEIGTTFLAISIIARMIAIVLVQRIES